MRTAAFLILVSVVFAGTAYLTLAVWRLPNSIAFPVLLFTTLGTVVGWIIVQHGPIEWRSTANDKRWAAEVEGFEHRRKEQQRIAQENKQQLLAAIETNPALIGFRALVERGVIQSAEDLDYRSNPGILHTCSHLRPIEERLRQAGCTVWLIHAWNYTPIPGAIVADAVLGVFPEPLEYKTEDYWDERSGPHFAASLACTQCNSIIHCTHPSDAGPGTCRLADL